MGIVDNIDYNKFPEQGPFLGLRVRVCFRYDERIIYGKVIREDLESPFKTIIQLDDNRVVLGTECMYSLSLDIDNIEQVVDNLEDKG